ncbi:hypothetical protein ACFL59_12270, partial [Planctomycetota bacterium]
IDFKAIDYLQGHVGSMSGHVDRYQQVLLGHLKNAKLLDANFDGRLDKDDLIFVKDARGEVNVQKIGQALRDRVAIGAAMVDASYAMSEAEHRFGGLEFNLGAWQIEDEDEEYDHGMGVMVPAPGIPPSVALRDIFNNPKLYQFECATALTIVRYKAILDLVGDKDFDRICPDLRVGPWEAEDHAKKTWKVSGQAARGNEVAADERGQAQVKPGEYTYFKNWDVSKSGFEGGWQGENVISLGEGLYYGHPFGVISGEDIVEYLNGHRKADSPRSASLLDIRARIDASILKHDRDPYG